MPLIPVSRIDAPYQNSYPPTLCNDVINTDYIIYAYNAPSNYSIANQIPTVEVWLDQVKWSIVLVGKPEDFLPKETK